MHLALLNDTGLTQCFYSHFIQLLLFGAVSKSSGHGNWKLGMGTAIIGEPRPRLQRVGGGRGGTWFAFAPMGVLPPHVDFPASVKKLYTVNDPKCAELGWRCVPPVETYCNWGEEARRTFALLATRLAFGSSSFRKAKIYHPG